MNRQITIRREQWDLAQRFAIARGSKNKAWVLVVEINENGLIGRGEAVPYARYGESLADAHAAVTSIAEDLRDGMSRAALQKALPASAARAAIDCALWDLEARLAKTSVWQMLGDTPPAPRATAYTLVLDTPRAMAEAARQAKAFPILKAKLGRDNVARDIERLAAIRAVAPDKQLICDMNEGWSPPALIANASALKQFNLTLIEQPLAAGEDTALAALNLPFCADESLHDSSTLAAIAPYYDWVNIKIDKTGGLTEALDLRAQARAMGKKIMVGCMVATSLALAPAHLLAQQADLADLDGALWIKDDRADGLVYRAGQVAPPVPRLWGG